MSRYIRDLQQWKMLWIMEHLLGKTPLESTLAARQQALVEQMEESLLSGQKGRIEEVERREDLAAHEFIEDYIKAGIPVVLSGAARDWPAVKRWSPEFFEQNYGDSPVQLINASREDLADDEFDPVGEVTTIGEVARDIQAGGGDYPRFAPLLYQHPELTEDFDEDFLRSLRGPLAAEMLFQFFMGAEGTNTALHAAIPNNLFVQIYGRKKWWIFPPEYSPIFRPPMLRSTYFMSPVDMSQPQGREVLEYINGYEVILEPGDILYNPPFYWHQVVNLTSTIGVGVRWFGLKSILKSSTTQTLLTLLATSPPVWRARQNRTNFVKNFVESVPK